MSLNPWVLAGLDIVFARSIGTYTTSSLKTLPSLPIEEAVLGGCLLALRAYLLE